MILSTIITLISILYKIDTLTSQDTLVTILPAMTVVGNRELADVHALPSVVGTSIYATKKSSLIDLSQAHGNLVSNTMRQVLAKVPGIFIWESEGSGIQINLANRGLSPNRSWEFNIRQNGFDLAADPYGYPEAYYMPQLQSVQRIELVRGHGSIQYGPQIGGMVNFILKDGGSFNKKFQVESFQTVGSNGLFNQYTGIGGKGIKLRYYTFFDHRSGNGWRQNNTFNSNNISASVTYRVSDQVEANVQVTRWSSLSKQPGGLSDEQFLINARQSLRSRNWFDLDWQVIAMDWNYSTPKGDRLNLKMFNVSGARRSVGFMPMAGILVDDVLITGGDYAERIVDHDFYRNYGLELRGLKLYSWLGLDHTLSSGFRAFFGQTDRFRGGQGSRLADPDFELVNGGEWTSEIAYRSINGAFFSEQITELGKRILVVPGFRLEGLGAAAEGYSGRWNGGVLPLQQQSRGRIFLLGGIGLEYLLRQGVRFYFNTTQSYRPVQFADLTTPPTTDVIDRNLRDASGLNTDLGLKGALGRNLKFDISAFRLFYDNRIGTLKKYRTDGSTYNLRTNVGSSVARGIEFFSEWMFYEDVGRRLKISGFGSWSNTDARYEDFKFSVVRGGLVEEENLKGKKVEYAPVHLLRTGFTLKKGNVESSLQWSFTGEVFTDANNTVEAGSNGQNGRLSSYGLIDWSMMAGLGKGFQFRGGINNLLDKCYATRRASGYPGPGLLPGEGRTFFLTFGFVMN